MEATATPRNQGSDSQEQCEAPENATTDLGPYESFKQLLQTLNWPAEELHAGVLKAVQDANPSILAALVKDLEAWRTPGNLMGTRDSLQRSRLISNRLHKAAGHGPILICQQVGGVEGKFHRILEQRGSNIVPAMSIPYMRFLKLLQSFKWSPEELHPEVLEAVRLVRPNVQAALVKDLEIWQTPKNLMGLRSSLERSRLVSNRLRKHGGPAPRIRDELRAPAATPGPPAFVATPLIYARFLALMKAANWSKEELHPDALAALQRASHEVWLNLLEDMETRNERGELANIFGLQRSQFLCKRLRQFGAQAPSKLEDKCTAPSPAKHAAAPPGVAPVVAPLPEGRLASAQVLLKSILGHDPCSLKTLHPSRHLTQEVCSAIA